MSIRVMVPLLAAGVSALTLGAVGAQTLSGSTLFLPNSDAQSRTTVVADSSTPTQSSGSSLSSEDAAQSIPAGMNIRIEGIPTETQTVDIGLQSFHWNEAIPANSTHGKVVAQEFQITTKENLASPRLMIAAARGERFPHAYVTIRKAGSQSEFLRWTLGNAMITSFQTATTSDDIVPTDTIAMTYDSIDLQITPIHTDGTAGTPVHAGWDLKTGKEL